MLRKHFHLLICFAIFGLACFTLGSLYSKTFCTTQYSTADENSVFSWAGNENTEQEAQKMPQMPDYETNALGPCPDVPPGLIGPLRVEFDLEQTLEKITKDVSESLTEGGRYKPPDCISQHKVAIIVPFRNRHEHLKYLLYYLHPILKRQQLDYGVYVINQDGDGVFNRAKLLNVGFVEAQKDDDYNCFVFSDVDLVPMDDRNIYKCFDNPRHLAVAMNKYKFALPYPTYFGGVGSFSKDQFLQVNGFANTYWGWGGEDDDMYKRVIARRMSISRPDLVTGKYKMIKHERDLHNEPNPKNPDKLRHTSSVMDTDGLNSLKYTVKESVKNILYTFITVDIEAPPS